MTEEPLMILVVDDDQFTAELTGLVLESSGYGVTVAGSGAGALEILASNPLLGLVVSDMHMPQMDGGELFRQMRSRGFNQPFVLLTGQDAQQVKRDNPEMNAVLQKDESFQEILVELVQALFHGNSQA